MTLRNELVQTLMETVNARSDLSVRADTAEIWHRLLGKFSPLIGVSSVYVLFCRSLEANRAAFPWLPAIHGDDPDAMLFTSFEAVVSSQASDEIIRATRALLSTYIDLLFGLIGTTLTMQFVCSAFRLAGGQRK